MCVNSTVTKINKNKNVFATLNKLDIQLFTCSYFNKIMKNFPFLLLTKTKKHDFYHLDCFFFTQKLEDSPTSQN